MYDSDGDGMGDGWEVFIGLDPLDPADAIVDIDNDGLSHYEEFLGADKLPATYDYSRITTDVFSGDWTYSWLNNQWLPAANPQTTPRELADDINNAADSDDSDNDGMKDGWEVLYGLNPNFDDSGFDPDRDGWDFNNDGDVGNPPNEPP